MSTDRFLGRLMSLAMLATAATGCGGKNYEPPPPADAAVARTALVKALDGWRSQVEPSDLEAADPPIAVSDFDLRAGRRLIEYSLLPGEEPAGPTIRWPVRLRLVQADGREEIIDVLYVITTGRRIHISRAD